MLADILPTSYEIGLVDGDMADGKTVAIVGAGPVGLAAVLCAAVMYKPKALITIDLDAGRLALAKEKFGATHTVQATRDKSNEALKDTDYTDVQAVQKAIYDIVGHSEQGIDVVVECVGLPGGWYISQEIVKPGGNIAVLGVHGNPVTLNLERMWYRNFKLTAGMVHGYSIERLQEKIISGELKAHNLISHYWKLSEIEKAYELFNSRKDGALKMLLTNDGPMERPAKRARTDE
jgi:alcohol dehydrogenase